MKKQIDYFCQKYLKNTGYKGLSSIIFTLLMCLNISVLHAGNFETAQKKVIKGVVSEESGDVLPGVSVMVKGTTTGGSITDVDGKYSIEIPGDDAILVFTYIGKQPMETPVKGKNRLDVVLKDNAVALDEVVIQTGYMTQKKADLTGSLALANASDIQKNPKANVMKSLQGKLAGVYVTSNGNPAEDVGIQIRGITSVNAAPPLIVVDGQPVTINLRDINTLDIESVQVLKDAASASIYGSRAASGVILIQTKKGKKGDLSIKYDGYVGVNVLMDRPRMLNTDQYGRAIWQATVNDGDSPATSARMYTFDWYRDPNTGIPYLNTVTPVEWLNSAKTMHSADTDWWNEVTQTNVTTNHQLTILGGGEKSTSLFSLNYYDNQGSVITSYFKRYTARMNSDYDLIKDHLKIGESFTVSYLDYNPRSDNYNSIIEPSIIPVHTTDGGWGGTAKELGMDDYNNPVRYLMTEKDNPYYFMKALGSTYLDLAVLKNLHLKTQFGVDYSNAYTRFTDHTWKEGGGQVDIENGVSNSQNHTITWTWTNTLTYNLEKGIHSLGILLGQEMYHLRNEWFNSYRSGIYSEDKDYAYIDAAVGDRKDQTGSGNEMALLSYFGKVNYSLASKYLFSATLRYDGASVFGENNQYGTFPAFSAGWRIKNESFLEDKSWLSDLKLRASWGMNGNSNIPTYSLINIYGSTYNVTSYAIKGNENGTLYSGYYKKHTGNPNLRWEATKQTNLGFDFGFLNQRIYGSFDYFIKKTNDMLYEPPYIGALGEGGYQFINGADMQNVGAEFLVTYASGVKSDFQYTVTLNASSFKNTVNDLPENVRKNYGNGMLDEIIGRPLHSRYGLVADGIFKTQQEVDNSPVQLGKGLGRIRYKDLDGDGRIDELYDRTWIGVWDPDFMAGLTFEGRYKKFDFSVFFDGVFGPQVYNQWKEYSDFWNITVQNDKNHPTRIMGAWSLTNQNSDIPALSRRNENGELRLSSYYIENGSYIKLRTMEVGYTLPRSVIEKAYIRSLRFYCQASNLFTLKKTWGEDKYTGPDPENPDFAYRIPLSLIFGVNLSF